MISYKPLFNTLDKNRMSLTEFRKKTGISTATLAKFRKNESMTLMMLDKICTAINCNVEDIVEITDGYMYYI